MSKKVTAPAKVAEVKKTKKVSAVAAFTAPACTNVTKLPALPKLPVIPPHDTSHMSVLNPRGATSSMFMQVLTKALTTRRGAGTVSEAKFCAWLAVTLGATMIDEAGNIHVDTRTDPATQRTLFTAHTDTCARGDGDNVVRVSADGTMWYADTETKECLGADDGAGIALMAGMIAAGVKAYFLFPRGEEVGGVGSSWLAKEMPKLFKQFDRAIAFDRADYTEVITHQGGERGASDECGAALAAALSSVRDDVMYMPSDAGVYTDTKEFFDLVPECFNIGVGYKHQHGSREQQDVAYLAKLHEVVCAVNWDALPTKRDPSVYDSKWGGFDGFGRGTNAQTHDSAWFFGSKHQYDEDGSGMHPADRAELDAYTALEAALDAAWYGSVNLLVDWVATHAALEYKDPQLSKENLVLTLQRNVITLTKQDTLDWLAQESEDMLSLIHI